MTDEELIDMLRNNVGVSEAACRAAKKAADRIEELRAALDEAEARIRKICLDALISYGQVEAERDAANALLWYGLLTVQTGRNEPLVIWSETVAAHLGAKP